ncbi:MAG: hypothetical protein KKG78_19325, partial [Alphaproteobacteria bacterium]|nr:hypothetical protein [Alphaproteobacteria bacterium]
MSLAEVYRRVLPKTSLFEGFSTGPVGFSGITQSSHPYLLKFVQQIEQEIELLTSELAFHGRKDLGVAFAMPGDKRLSSRRYTHQGPAPVD